MSATLKHNDLFALFDDSGGTSDAAHGFYWRDTRHLSHLTLNIDRCIPAALSSGVGENNVLFRADLAISDRVHVRRSRFLWNATSHDRLIIEALDDDPLHLTVEAAADFADLFEVRGTTRLRRGTTTTHIESDGITYTYDGLDSRRRSTRLRFDPPPDRIEDGRCIFDLPLPARRRRTTILIEIAFDRPVPTASVRRGWATALTEAMRAGRRSAHISTSNPTLDAAVRRSLSDLRMLTVETPHGLYPHAGVPWYSAVFGRDALIAALLTLWFDPALARGVLSFLAAEQANADDASCDAEPGKILHEMRHGEMAKLGEVPFWRYFGSVDSTPLFVMLAGAYLERTNDLATIETLWPAIEAALRWIDGRGGGFIEYARRTVTGLVNQGWKDSDDCVFHADGDLAKGPIAICEVQAYAYAARRAASMIAARLGQARRARDLSDQADALRLRFDREFWCEDIGTYALALDGEKRPCRIRTYNAGHALFAGIALPGRAARLAATLMAPSSFSGWGIRTLATTEARYDPRSYHNGSVWPHDTALIALGLARYGFHDHAEQIRDGLLAAAIHSAMRLPELLCGFERQPGAEPVLYPVACSPQAWAAASLPGLLNLRSRDRFPWDIPPA